MPYLLRCGLTDDDALNVIIYDLCDRAAGREGDVLECAKAQNGRARVNGNLHVSRLCPCLVAEES